MKPRLLQTLPDLPDLLIRDVAFQGEATLLFTERRIHVWRFSLENGETARLHTRKQLGSRSAIVGGMHPLLAVSPRGDALVVADDAILAGWEGERGPWHTLWGVSGYDDPHLEFSPDGERFAAFMCGDAIAYETSGWRRLSTFEDTRCVTWHPTQPVLLGVEMQGRLSWFDLQQGAGPRPLGPLHVDPGIPFGDPAWKSPPVFLSLAFLDEGNIVVLVSEGSGTFLDFWQLEPLECWGRVPTDADTTRVTRVPGQGLFTVEGRKGSQVWDAATYAPVSEFFPDQRLLRFSPSGRRFLTGKLIPDRLGNRLSVSVWSVE